MNQILLEQGSTRVGVGMDGFLYPIEFGRLSPMHRAPWWLESHPDALEMLQRLRGDFFCAPFGDSDLLPDEQRPHGASANGTWHWVVQQAHYAKLELAVPIMEATLFKEVWLEGGVVYQRHQFVGGHGHIPIGHHAMLQTYQQLELSFSPFVLGATPPMPLEPNPKRGHSSLLYPQEFSRLEAVKNSSGGITDISYYPHTPASEDLVMLVSSLEASLAWSAAYNRAENWLWVGFKNPHQLRSTVLWQSNGGRSYPPFSSRHKGVLGIEEVSAYFHLGHRASLDNPLLGRGIATHLTLETNPSVAYAITCLAVPEGFGKLRSVEAKAEELRLVGESGQTVKLPFVLAWLM